MKVHYLWRRNARKPCTTCSGDRTKESGGGWMVTSYMTGMEYLCNGCMATKYPVLATQYKLFQRKGKYIIDAGRNKFPPGFEEL